MMELEVHILAFKICQDLKFKSLESVTIWDDWHIQTFPAEEKFTDERVSSFIQTLVNNNSFKILWYHSFFYSMVAEFGWPSWLDTAKLN